MPPEEIVAWVLAVAAVSYINYLKLRVIRPLRRKLETADSELATLKAGQEESEVRRLRERVQVLERIATEKNSSIEQEFERLRAGE